MIKNKQKRIFIIDIGIFTLFLLSLFWVFLAPVKQVVTLDLYYRQSDPGIVSQLFWGENGELSAENFSDGSRDGNVVVFELPQKPEELMMLRIDPSNTDSVYSITHIGYMLNGEYFRTMTVNEISEKFVPVNASFSISGEELIITPQNSDSGILIDSEDLNASAREASAALRARQIRQRFFAMLLLAAALVLLNHFAESIVKYAASLFKRDENGRLDWFTLFATAVMAGAFLVVIVIGLLSELGLHPDEWDVKQCLDYGMTHFLPPDMRDPAVAGTYSGYGYTKLENYTWYWFLAGKVALLFKSMLYASPYYRIPNILLFAVLAVFFVRNVKKQNWLMVTFGICVQAWYIFSYTTADALDFFLSFFAVYEISVENSLLYRLVDTPKVTRKNFLGFALAGLLFGMIALGKQNYLAILALIFFVLVFKLVRQKEKSCRGRLWRNYIIIVAIFLVVVVSRAGFDVVHYGTDKSAIKETMAVQYADTDKNPATPIEEQNISWHMFERGNSLLYLFEENPRWFAMSYQSFCGFVEDNDTGLWYYSGIGLLYAAIFLSIGIAVFRKKNNIWGRIEFITGTLLMAGNIAASILNSWLIDSQAQGRYLLPMILIAGFLCSRTPELFKKRYFKVLLIAAGVLSVGYFGLVGVPEFL